MHAVRQLGGFGGQWHNATKTTEKRQIFDFVSYNTMWELNHFKAGEKNSMFMCWRYK